MTCNLLLQNILYSVQYLLMTWPKVTDAANTIVSNYKRFDIKQCGVQPRK